MSLFLKTAWRHNFTLVSPLSVPVATDLPITGSHEGDKQTHEGDTLVPAVPEFYCSLWSAYVSALSLRILIGLSLFVGELGGWGGGGGALQVSGKQFFFFFRI